MPFSPEEVLFRRKGAPVRYMEDDIYFANEKELPGGGQGTLPESDLLQSVHSYTSQFYDRMPVEFEDQGDESVDFRSMDGTALLAFGVLLEEAGKEALGRKGDLVFTEGRQESSEDEAPVAESSISEAVGELSVKSLRRTRQSKKRKMDS
ncbi:hypothetical protein Golomagni_07494 [Golovinomyces magnicellulatus]|nr:hypothetical protein Golomagni_07494 [Golovinomyces magnicellulatus]